MTSTHGTDQASGRILRRRGAALICALFIAGSAALFALAPEPKESNGPTAGLPDSADSTEVARLVETLPSSDVAPAIVVVTRPGSTLNAEDQAAVEVLGAELERFSVTEVKAKALYSQDQTVALLAVPLKATTGFDQIAELRTAADRAAPDRLSVQVTGGPAFQADIKDVFAGADLRLLIATALVVAVLLLLTYRSPWLWLVPLVVVALGDRVAALAVAIATRVFDYTVDGSTTGITSVLVFGAGTNYALLLIARYREELRRHEDRYVAMASAWRRTAPAVLASSGTVTLALLTLSLADTPLNRALGWSAAIGIVVAVLFGLVALPAVMLLFGRGLFWPFVPRPGQQDPSETGWWARVGRTVVARPRTYAAGAGVLLAVLALGAVGTQVGLTQNERFREVPEAVVGQETLAKAFPAGFAEPNVVLTTPELLAQVESRVKATEGVASVNQVASSPQWSRLDVVLDSDRGSDRARATVESLRNNLHDVGGGSLVGGPDAEDLDAADAASHDRLLIIPLVLVVVLAILLLLLRSVVASLVLVATVVATYVSAMGAGWLVFTHLFDFPALDLPVPLFSFIFLVALGVDYNIFLATRAREEAADKTIGPAMTSALAVTGGVITSAGIVLAAVFAVLGVLPLVTLTQIGVVVGIGVLLDTVVVRSVLVPALAVLIGERFWWPGRPSA